MHKYRGVLSNKICFNNTSINPFNLLKKVGRSRRGVLEVERQLRIQLKANLSYRIGAQDVQHHSTILKYNSILLIEYE